jgi:hypothetical protein
MCGTLEDDDEGGGENNTYNSINTNNASVCKAIRSVDS